MVTSGVYRRVRHPMYLSMFTSCDADREGMNRLRTMATVVDPSGDQRVRLVYITRSKSNADSEGFDFDSMVWERRLDGTMA